MLISIADPILQTQIFTLLLLAAVAFTMRKKPAGSLGVETTTELKGFAIIAILLAHIGYYLAADHRFLFPLSVLAGVGVDLFLFMSGFGLTASALTRELSIRQFYQRRLKKIYIPLWLTLALFFLMDLLILGKAYSWSYIFHAFLGWFQHANLYSDIDSPLWYISLILFYYLLFPFIFSKRYAVISAFGLYAVTYAIALWNPGPLREMMSVYQIHTMAFPLGMLAAKALQGRKSIPGIRNPLIHYLLLGGLLFAAGYFAIYSGVGKDHWVAEGISILTVAFILGAFLVKRFDIKLFYLFGVYSFEIYLIHWPILYRYDIFFRFLPASLALIAYGAFFLGIGWIFQESVKRIDRE